MSLLRQTITHQQALPLNAHGQYELLVGEIGQPRREVLHELRQWEIIAIIRGYRRRDHSTWEASRLQTFFILRSLGANMNEPQELITFPWEKDRMTEVSDEEVEQLKALIRQENEKIKV